MIGLIIKYKDIVIKNFEIKNINKDYMSWFSGMNENLIYSRHYKKKYKRIYLIKNLINFINSKNIFLGIFEKKKIY